MMHVDVLDDGYVRLEDSMGSDLTVVNAARASYRNKSEKLSKKDKRLIKYLAKHGHQSPFRHCSIQLEVRAPIMVCRQWWKYVVGSHHGVAHGLDTNWNETSGRYVTQDWKFYKPSAWRRAPQKSKQGSAGDMNSQPAGYFDSQYNSHVQKSLGLYHEALDKGMAPEMARLFLPYAALYTNWYWTASLQAVLWFIYQRHPDYDGDHAQWEIQQYAKAVKDIIDDSPVSYSSNILLKYMVE